MATIYIDGLPQPKVYRAMINQSGTNPPVSTIIRNELGVVPVWSRNISGEYVLTSVGNFPYGRTFFNYSENQTDTRIDWNVQGDSIILICTADDILIDMMLEIWVYPPTI